jgi:hypothetical protein
MNGKASLSKTLIVVISVIVMFSTCATGGAVPSTEQVVDADQAAQYEQAMEEYLYNILRGVLRMNHTFRGTTENADLKLRFDFSNENLSILKTRYALDAIAGRVFLQWRGAYYQQRGRVGIQSVFDKEPVLFWNIRDQQFWKG